LRAEPLPPRGAENWKLDLLFVFPLWGKYRRSRGRGLTGAVIQIERISVASAIPEP